MTELGQSDQIAVLDLLMRGEKIPAISDQLDIDKPALKACIKELQESQGLLLQYRAIQSLKLTAIQAKILDAITPDKIQSAPLRDLVMAFKILKDKEQVIEGKPSEIKGLVGHLIYMEKQERALKDGTESPRDPFIDAVFTDELPPSDDVRTPEPLSIEEQLAELDKEEY